MHKAYYFFTCTCVSINSFHSHSHSHIWLYLLYLCLGKHFHEMLYMYILLHYVDTVESLVLVSSFYGSISLINCFWASLWTSFYNSEEFPTDNQDTPKMICVYG